VTWLSRGLEWILEVGLHRRRPRVTRPFVPEEVRRILVVRKDNIGDVLCTRPALRALRRAFPDAHLAILVAEHCRAAVERNPDPGEVLAYTKAKHHPGFLGLPALWELSQVIRDLRRRRFDLAIAMGRPCSRSSAWLAYVSGACWRLGYSTPALRPFPFFLNLRCDPGTMTSHEVDGCLELLATLGIPSAGRKLTLIPDPGRRQPLASAWPSWGPDGRRAWPSFTSATGGRPADGPWRHSPRRRMPSMIGWASPSCSPGHPGMRRILCCQVMTARQRRWLAACGAGRSSSGRRPCPISLPP